MSHITRRDLLGSLVTVPIIARAAGEWIPLFDGRTLEGWKANESPGSWRVEGGSIAAGGPRSHLFYTGKVSNAEFKNFELKAEVLARPRANSGIYFHTRFQPAAWPDAGFEVQVANTALGEGNYRERKKTGSLYGVRDVYKQLVNDDEWFQLHVTVKGKQVQIRLNDMLVVDYVEPDPPVREGVASGRVLDRGTFALQCHDAGSKALFRKIAVRPLPDDLPTAAERPTADEVYRDILKLHAKNFPVVDYHVHLKGGLTLDEALRESRRVGIQYGIAVNCGLGFPTTTDAAAGEFLQSMRGQPCFVAMQAEGREWVRMFSKQTIAKFDYVFTDAMTFTDDGGKRMRLWIKEEVGEIRDPQRFMDTLVNRIVGLMRDEPIDIYANPTFLPDAIAADYDKLWTAQRIDTVVQAAKHNGVAMEINNRYRIPSGAVIRAAKKAGVKFSFGTNNSDRNLGRIEYALKMVKECGLTWDDIFIPRAADKKRVMLG